MIGKRKHRQIPKRRQVQPVQEQPSADIKSFRMGRTLTGSRSARISSTNELNAEMVSPRAKTHHLVRHRRRLFGRLIVVAIVCVGIYLFLGQLVATVNIRAFTGREVTMLTASQEKAYLTTIDEYFSRRINERFRPNLSTTDLTGYMQNAHPEIESLDVNLVGGFGEAQLSLHMQRPVARWVVDGKTQFVNQHGVVFAENFYPTPKVTIVDKNATEVDGGLVASNRFLSFVGQVVGDLEKRNLRVTRATIPTLTTRQLELKIKGVKPHFKLTVDRPAGEQSEDIARIVKYFKKHGNKPAYVDVRVKGKAFYK